MLKKFENYSSVKDIPDEELFDHEEFVARSKHVVP